MSFIATIAADAAEGETAEMYRRQQATWGFVPNYAKVFGHRPEIMARWGALLAEIKRPMDPRRFELATFAAAHELGNSACALAHGRGAAASSSATPRSSRSPRAGSTASSTIAEQAMVRFARQVARDASRVDRDRRGRARAPGVRRCRDLRHRRRRRPARAFFTKMLDALGVQVDSPLGPLERPWRRALTVGRPIDERPPETMPAPAPASRHVEGDRHAA